MSIDVDFARWCENDVAVLGQTLPVTLSTATSPDGASSGNDGGIQRIVILSEGVRERVEESPEGWNGVDFLIVVPACGELRHAHYVLFLRVTMRGCDGYLRPSALPAGFVSSRRRRASTVGREVSGIHIAIL